MQADIVLSGLALIVSLAAFYRVLRLRRRLHEERMRIWKDLATPADTEQTGGERG